jgi:hypothetical protein
MVRATFWSSKLSTPRSHRHWFCTVIWVFITNVMGTFFGMSESGEASKRR